MKRGHRYAWAALLIAVAFVAALWALPARWVMAWIPESSPVIVTDASGSMWSASATVALGASGLRRTLPDPLQWRLTLGGGPELQLEHPWLRGPLTLSLTWRGLRLSAQSLQLPASALTTVHSVFNTLDPGGEVLLNWPELTLGLGPLASRENARLLTAQWRNASSALSRVKPMGRYNLELNQAGSNTLSVALDTMQGPLMMKAAGTVSRPQGAKLDGKAWVDESASGDVRAALQGFLDAMGPRSGPDEVILKIR